MPSLLTLNSAGLGIKKERKMKNKKVLFITISVLAICIIGILNAFAHSGRTDGSGGHRDNKNQSGLGYYHYHCGGYPAHLHSGGVCPYKAKTYSSNKPVRTPSPTPKPTPDRYDIGYDDGYDKGYDEGYDVGLDEGYDKGYSIGHSVGYDEGLHKTTGTLIVIAFLFILVIVIVVVKRRK